MPLSSQCYCFVRFIWVSQYGWVGRDLKDYLFPNSLSQTGTPCTPGCSEPHPSCPWTLPRIEHPLHSTKFMPHKCLETQINELMAVNGSTTANKAWLWELWRAQRHPRCPQGADRFDAGFQQTMVCSKPRDVWNGANSLTERQLSVDRLSCVMHSA